MQWAQEDFNDWSNREYNMYHANEEHHTYHANEADSVAADAHEPAHDQSRKRLWPASPPRVHEPSPATKLQPRRRPPHVDRATSSDRPTTVDRVHADDAAIVPRPRNNMIQIRTGELQVVLGNIKRATCSARSAEKSSDNVSSSFRSETNALEAAHAHFSQLAMFK